MRSLTILTAWLVFSHHLSGQIKPRPDFWADALSWFLVWNTPGSINTAGTACHGFITGREKIQFRCADEMIVADVTFTDSGCLIRFMRRAYSDEVNTPSAPVTNQEFYRLNSCSGNNESTAKIVATSLVRSSREWDQRMSQDARDKGLSYAKRTGLAGCTMHFPKVYRDEPFFHVYRECSGMVDAIWEFPIIGGSASGYAHWTYTRQRDNLPPGSDTRLRDASLWFASTRESRQQRSPAR